MNKFVCVDCGAVSYSAASLENLYHKECERCMGKIVQVPMYTQSKPEVGAQPVGPGDVPKPSTSMSGHFYTQK
jgi:hypothetical protein